MDKNYETVIGLEIHVQLKTKSKMFCRCNNDSTKVGPNLNTCPVCFGMPGVLPVINKEAIKWTILTGFALNCNIPNVSKFDRKNYFYPDLPKGYQISQFDLPLCKKGYLEIIIGSKDKFYNKKICITRIHLEEDAGKLVHPKGEDYSLVDLNRAGTPLMEIVTEPDIRTPEEAKIFLQNLHSILRYLDVSYANMEEGNLRCDANISIKLRGEKVLGQKVEIKNMNSFKAVEKALAYEADRQTEIIKEGNKIIHETRGWDENKGKTIAQRSKEESHDYRYFPEPDLPPLNLKSNEAVNIEKIKAELPELPTDKKKRFQEEYGLSEYDANVLVSEPEIARFFEQAIEHIPEQFDSAEIIKAHAKRISNWITVELIGLLRLKQIRIEKSKIKPPDITSLVEKIEKGEISGKIGKEVFAEMFDSGKSPNEIIKSKGLKQISSKNDLDKIVGKVLKENEKSVEDYKQGKKQVLVFLVGQVMQKTHGQANPNIVNKILQSRFKK
jgi:aspartyl-tRNA(Asn)/glutamyl-tRNA(Gln) amidotransferase subunit B